MTPPARVSSTAIARKLLDFHRSSYFESTSVRANVGHHPLPQKGLGSCKLMLRSGRTPVSPAESSTAFRGVATEVSLPADVRIEDAERFVSKIRGASTIRLDCRGVQRVRRLAGCLLTSPLIGSSDDVPVEVRLPQSPFARQEVLSRSGVLFALAHRRGVVEHDGGPKFESVLRAFRRAPQAQLSWDPSKAVGGLNIGSRSHAWTNLHYSLLNYGGDNFGAALRKWVELDVLRSRTPRLAEALLDDIVLISSELLENVIEHAVTDVQWAGGPRSLAHVMVTEGGARSHDRLYVTMQDNGLGITRTARRKLAISERHLSEEELLVHLVRGTLLTFPSHRGRGLPSIWDAAQRQGGKLQIATKETRVFGNNGMIKSQTSSASIDGTAIILMFPLSG